MRVEHAAALICAWLATYFIHSTLLLGGAWLTTRKMPARFDALSEIIWRGALLLPIATTPLQHYLASMGGGRASVGVIEYTPQAYSTALVPRWIWIGVAAFWLFGAAAGLAHFCYWLRQFRLAIADRTPLSAAKLEVVESVVGEGEARLSVTDRQTLPFALAREICLPAWMVERMGAAELRAVVAHELAHVRRHDALWRMATAVVRRSLFFQPLNWLALARLRELSECICDDEAVATTRSRISLAAALETVARRATRHRAHLSLAPAMGAPVSLTLRRVQRILSTDNPRIHTQIRPAYPAGGMLLVAAAALWLAPMVTLPGTAFLRYTVNAQDPVGRFSITMEKGRVVAATLGGRPLRSSEVRQNGATVRLLGGSQPLSLRVTPQGGIKWQARRPAASLTHRM